MIDLTKARIIALSDANEDYFGLRCESRIVEGTGTATTGGPAVRAGGHHPITSAHAR
jgi:hypothetical protein